MQQAIWNQDPGGEGGILLTPLPVSHSDIRTCGIIHCKINSCKGNTRLSNTTCVTSSDLYYHQIDIN
jgi:hypothetical protein